ncbi:hypothetical protein FM109_16275 [Vibrio casei]|nr:hypothetical protein FM109_16275 [Vibrio casei]
MDFGALYTIKTGQNTRKTASFSMTFHFSPRGLFIRTLQDSK